MKSTMSAAHRRPRSPVLDIVQQVNALYGESHSPRFEGNAAGATSPADCAELDLLIDRRERLQDLAFTVSARNLADAAALLALARNELAWLENYDLDPAERTHRQGNIRRALANALPFVADAAGVDLQAIGADWLATV
jgi:hypothetical protein